MSANNIAEKFVRMGRARAAESLPYFAEALYAARLVISPHCPSLAAIDQHFRIYFNPQLVEHLLGLTRPEAAVEQLGWVWVHEISHALREHGRRARDIQAEPRRWNVAADLEINDTQWENLAPPTAFPPLLPAGFDLLEGQLAESYYQQLNACKSGQSQRISKRSATVGPAAPADEGSGVHGQPRDWELGESESEGSSLSEIEQSILRIQVARQLDESRQRGTLPGGWQRWVDQVLHPTVDWRELLLRRVRGAVATNLGNRGDYSYGRAHRREHVYAPLVRPSLVVGRLPNVACVVDTSGSMSQHQLSACLAEVRGVLEALHLPITVIPCDCTAYAPIRILSQSQLIRAVPELPGGGGTDMVAGIEAALKLRPAPDAVIVLTDGYTDYPPRPYRTPVIFGLLPTDFDHDPPLPPIPPWRSSDIVRIRRSAEWSPR